MRMRGVRIKSIGHLVMVLSLSYSLISSTMDLRNRLALVEREVIGMKGGTGFPAQEQSLGELATKDRKSKAGVLQPCDHGARTPLSLSDLHEQRAAFDGQVPFAAQSNNLSRGLEAPRGVAQAEYCCRDVDSASPYTKSFKRIEGPELTDLRDAEPRYLYTASIDRYYEHLIDQLMEKSQVMPGLGYDVVAFEACEYNRTRLFTERLRSRRVVGSPNEIPETDDERDGASDIDRPEFKKIAPQVQGVEEEFDSGSKLYNRVITKSKSWDFQSPNTRSLDAFGSANNWTAVQSHFQPYVSYGLERDSRPQKIEAVHLDEVQNTLLDPDTLVLEYFLGEIHSYLWVVGETSIRSYILPGRDQIEREVHRFYAELTSGVVARESAIGFGDSQRGVGNLANARNQLSRTLLGPTANDIGSKRLVIIPDGALHYVPFAALTKPGTKELLVASNELINLPSLAVLRELRAERSIRRQARKTLAIIADPVVDSGDPRLLDPDVRLRRDRHVQKSLTSENSSLVGTQRSAPDSGWIHLTRLVFAAEEAKALSELVPKDEQLLATGLTANRQLVTGTELAQYRIVHFATHSLLDPRDPFGSSLVLSRFDQDGHPHDGLLRLKDIYHMKLSADLVVLSACRTALGTDVKGEGFIGLTQGFIYAGATRLISTLWSADDAASAELMDRFYRKFLGPEKLSVAAALREAQKSMSLDPRWEDPYFWAGFVLEGDWN
ncbi:MAG: hypothetical protein DMF61_14815 [Blastocatellia bacterium AA13]|nr:MAG: hypothetical protein DMF61_14815 [Blastocatellia bacterium AA13]